MATFFPASVRLPVAFVLGQAEVEVGTVDIPLTSQTAPRVRNGRFVVVEMTVDSGELRRRIAALLRATATRIEEGRSDG